MTTKMNDDAKVGKKIVDYVAQFSPSDLRDDAIVELYMAQPRRGDPYDMRSNAVDVMCAVGHYAVHRGYELNDIFENIDNPHNEYGRVFAAMKRYIEKLGHSWDDVDWLVKDHLHMETGKPSSYP